MSQSSAERLADAAARQRSLSEAVIRFRADLDNAVKELEEKQQALKDLTGADTSDVESAREYYRTAESENLRMLDEFERQLDEVEALCKSINESGALA